MSESVQSITDAPLKHSVEQRSRMVKYTVAMLFRIVCFTLAIVTGVVWETWWSLVLVALAIVVPYVAVVDANVSGERYSTARTEATQRRAEITADVHDGETPQWWEENAAFEHLGFSSAEETIISGEIDDSPTEPEIAEHPRSTRKEP